MEIFNDSKIELGLGTFFTKRNIESKGFLM